MNTILADADAITNGEKQQAWGDPTETHGRIAQCWSAILNHPVDAHHVALCMAGLKLVRASINPLDGDSLLDAAGYCKLGWGCVGKAGGPSRASGEEESGGTDGGP